MTDFVLDNSVTMRWLLESPTLSDQKYAEQVLNSLSDVDAIVVPNLWHLEVCSVLLGAEKCGKIEPGDIDNFLCQLGDPLAWSRP